MNGKSFMLMLFIAWLLTGCGSAESSSIEETATAAEAAGSAPVRLADVEAADIADVPAALATMNGIVKSLKQTVEQDPDAPEVAEQAGELAALWKAVEADVRAAHEAHAADLEAGIAELAEAASQRPADRDWLIEADYRIYQVLRDVSALFE